MAIDEYNFFCVIYMDTSDFVSIVGTVSRLPQAK